MAILLDATSNSGTKAAIAAGTFTHTVGASLSKSILVFTSGMRDTTGTAYPLGTVTYNGVNLTKVRSDEFNNGATNERSEIWYLLNPTAGANSLVFKMTGVTADVAVGAISLQGVDQSNPIDAQTGGTQNPTSGTFTRSITTIANNAWAIDALYTDSDNAISGTNQTAVNYNLSPHTAGDQSASSRFENITPAGAKAFIWTGAQAGAANAHSIVSLKPSPAGTNLIQSAGTAVLGVGSTSVTWPANTTAGNLIVVGVALTNAITLGTVTSITDNQSNTYFKAVSGTLSSVSDVLNVELWYAKSITAGAGSVTVNHTVDNTAMYIREYSGFNTLDVMGSASGSSTAPNSGTVTTTQATELLVIATGDDNGVAQTWTPKSDYGDMVGTATTLTGISMEDKIVTSTGAQTGTLTLGAAANWDSLIATFYLASSGAIGYRNLLGVGI
jgi:hypothetical protein